MTVDIDTTPKGVLPVRWTQEMFLYPQSKEWTPNNMTHILLEPRPDGKQPQLCLQNPAVPPFVVTGLQCCSSKLPGAAQLAGSGCSCPLLKKMDCRLTTYALHSTTTQATGTLRHWKGWLPAQVPEMLQIQTADAKWQLLYVTAHMGCSSLKNTVILWWHFL